MSHQPGFPPPNGRRPSGPLAGSEPVGSQPPPHVSIETFTPPPSKVTPAVIFVVIALSVVIAAFGFGVLGNRPSPSPTPTPTPTSTASAPVRTGGLEFESSRDGAAGYWQVLSARRSGNIAIINVRVDLDKGRMGYQFYVYDNADAKSYDPEPLGPPPVLSDGQLSAGQNIEGTLSFRVPGNNMTLIMANGSGAPVSGLAITL